MAEVKVVVVEDKEEMEDDKNEQRKMRWRGNCAEVCPFAVLEIKDGKAVVKHPGKCRKCRACMSACPNNAIEIED